MVIQHNISSLNAWRNTAINSNGVSKNLEKLSSGFRVNRAADDAAGLAISEKMRGQIRGTKMAQMNVEHGIEMINTSEGATQEIHSILQRMRELSVQSANGTYHDDVDREALDKELQALKSEIDRIADTTEFNGVNLLNSEASGIAYPLKVMNANDPEAVQLGLANVEAGGYDAGTLGSTWQALQDTFGFEPWHMWYRTYNMPADAEFNLTIESNPGTNPTLYLEYNGKLYEGTFGRRDDLPIPPNPLGNNYPGYRFIDENNNLLLDFCQGNTDTPLAAGFQSGTIYGLSTQPNTLSLSDGSSSLLSQTIAGTTFENAYLYVKGNLPEVILQVGPNTDDEFSISRFNVKTNRLGIDPNMVRDIDISTRENANGAIPIIDRAINQVSGVRAYFGAAQNRLEHIHNNLGASGENLQAAESSIRDLDMAKEMMGFTKNNILVQAAQSMLAQSNQLPQGVLSLLR